ncbi:MAG TPA: hypothetical protein VGS19_16240, partial [Streptosporangiaceae bacterium]|nr:hypothetical protein [Streptosporangiaceae bacterium]
MGMRKKLTKNDGAIVAALALAAHYFPQRAEDGTLTSSFTHAAFLLGGHYDAWAAWRGLSQPEKQRITAVLAAAPEELTRVGVFRARARRLLDVSGDDEMRFPFRLAGDTPGRAEAAVPMVGGDLLGCADRMLAELRKDHRRRAPEKPAGPGDWLTRTWYAPGNGLVQGRATIPEYAGAGDDASPAGLEVTTVAYQPEVSIDTAALLEL